ncbi:MAG: 5-(carboxyamino)imidazole ribonucleotide synthase [Sphingomonadaceae bacterium]
MSVAPGSVIGIVGGGQLGRMLAAAAARLGYRCHVYAPEEMPPAAEVAARFTRGDYRDAGALARFGGEVDVATYEFENIPADALAALAGQVPLHPPRAALETAQDRLSEKRFIAGLGGDPAEYRAVASREELGRALEDIGCPAILKTRRFGYDGKGQTRIASADDLDRAWERVGGAPSVLETLVDFDAEFSILLCRAASGETALWNAPRNIHEGGILARSLVPAGEAVAKAVDEAAGLARRAAESLDYVGMLTMEFFAAGGRALFNEMAPRVHNSGHWTIEGATTSQFENHVRAICGLPLGATGLVAPRVEMRNLIGGEIEGWRDWLATPGAHLHIYGKREVKPGRKMGHVTRLGGIAAES